MSSRDKSEDGVARQLADEQRQASIAEFFEKNKQMLGFGSKNRALVTAVKEGVDNSLDAAEEARILPDIKVDIEKKDEFYTVTIEDNGPGIPRKSVPDVFGKLLYGSRFHREMQQRGQQGIGISAAVLYSQLTSGNPARVRSKTKESGQAYYLEIGIDTDNNEPNIHTEEKLDWDEKDHGIKIELDLEANMRARKRLHTYIRNTAVVNPHATIELHEPENDIVYDERPVDELPDAVEEIKPHPHGVELGTLLDMLEATDSRKLKSFFKSEFTRVGDKTAESIVNGYKDRLYGRYLGLKLESEHVDKEDYIEAITDSVNRKGKEQTDEFASILWDNISNYNMLSYAQIMDAVDDAASKATDRTDKQFGETVRNSVYDAVWNIISNNIYETISYIVKDVTVDRKSEDLLYTFSYKFSELIESNGKLIKEDELHNFIEEASKFAVEKYNGGSSFGDKAQEKVFNEIWSKSSTINKEPPKISDISSDRDNARHLLNSMRDSDAMAPPTKCISPITEEHIEAGLKSQYDADFYTACTRGSSVANGKPFVVEAGIAYGGEIKPKGQIELSRFANRVPLVYQQGACAITKQVQQIRWNNYYKGDDMLSQGSNSSIPQGPMVLLVHIASTNVPFTSESKDAVADVPEMEKEIERAIREVARDLKDHLKVERTRKQRKQKLDTIGGLLDDMTSKIESITEEDIESKKESQARILNNIFVRKTGDKTVRITNFGKKNEEIKILIETDSGTKERKRTVSKGESESIYMKSKIASFNIEEPVDPKVTVKE